MWKNLKRQVELPLRLRFVRETADGMNYLHTLQSKILHMDLKPGNILLNDDLHVKVTCHFMYSATDIKNSWPWQNNT